MIIMTKKKMYEMPHKLPSDLRLQDLRKLVNFKKIPEMFKFGKRQILTFVVKNREKPAVHKKFLRKT